MAAISKAWVTIGDAAVDPDSPGDTTLMTGIRDNLVHLREWLGASFFAGAVQDHNHDGVNSASIQVGPNLVRNGSFEDDSAGWTITDYTGGSHAFSTSTRHHGAKSLAITSTSTGNGGGDALTNEFIAVAGSAAYTWGAQVSASGANVSSRLSIVWYDAAQAQISEANLYNVTDTPTTKKGISGCVQAPSTARFAKLRVTGGVPGAGSATGTIFWDDVQYGVVMGGLTPIIPETSFPAANNVDIVDIPQNFSALLVLIDGASANAASQRIQTLVSTNNGSSFDNTASNYIGGRISNGAAGTMTIAGMAWCGTLSLASDAVDQAILITGYQEGMWPRGDMSGVIIGVAQECSQITYVGSKAAVNALRIQVSGGGNNFDAGTYALFGVG